ncbi:hypothetical protein CO613_11600 [Lysobacteraceae bacterium NML07-0707]|nr:hypothetical protein CO613_11600 [Xanthomonadaceae bacterium NML07-0707]
MLRRFLPLLPPPLLLTACGTGYGDNDSLRIWLPILLFLPMLLHLTFSKVTNSIISPENYLMLNISEWKRTQFMLNNWITGEPAQRIMASLEIRKPIPSVNLEKTHKDVSQQINELQEYPVPSDAADVHEKLILALKDVEAFLDNTVKLTHLPENFSNEQATSLLEAREAALGSWERNSEMLDAAQKAYAQKHRINLISR